jgi:hypothetical protein
MEKYSKSTAKCNYSATISYDIPKRTESACAEFMMGYWPDGQRNKIQEI